MFTTVVDVITAPEQINSTEWRIFRTPKYCVQSELMLKLWWRCNYINYGIYSLTHYHCVGVHFLAVYSDAGIMFNFVFGIVTINIRVISNWGKESIA